jgi:SHS2 domain-containing protein
MNQTEEPREHTGEVVLHLHAGSLAELFAEAARKLRELQLPRVEPHFPVSDRTVSVEARDRGGLLVEWLNELIYLGEHDRWVATEFGEGSVTDTEARFTARGVSPDIAPSAVKAATLHGLRVVPRDGGWEAEVLLDV